MIKRKQQQKGHSSSESGFTIIESLVALIVVAILLTAITPVIVLSTATRVQARRIELATQAAKSYIDSIRTRSITAPDKTIPLAPASSTTTRNLRDNSDNYLINATNMPPPTNSTEPGLYCFKKDSTIVIHSTCNSDDLFYIQAAQIMFTNSQPTDGYRLGIRVYRADVDFSKTLTASTGDTRKTQNTFTGGLGDRQAPLVEMTTDIGSRNTTYQALCQRLGVATGKNCN
ncbi:MAG: hormogonium polysaccharide secretion pseudopilin HpsB [Rhizonema sp. PD38]|nr:hormogonium polysaccharide secretion pseudopilin HpsB [Rhizonema sp. PD38]